MNNTLTGLGVALVLALLAALIGPWFVNWTAYRDDFARQASALVGAPVTLTGAVDARLLPSPYVRFHGLKAGSGASALSVDEVEIELAIAPLFRGEFKAERLKLVRPRVGLELLADGTARTAFSARKAGAPAPSASFDRADIVDGAMTAATPSGRVALDRINGFAEAGSLSGPFRFEGEGALAGEKLRLRLSTARLDANSAMRAKFAVERESRPETLEIDGALTVAARPRFEGRVVLARTPPRLRGADAAAADEPWRIAADVKTQGALARTDTLDVSLGADDRAIRIGGRGAIRLGEKPDFDLALESRQIDLDRAAGPERAKTPAAMLQAVAERVGLGTGPALDGRLAIDLKGLVLAGDVVRDLKAEMRSRDGAWRIDRASAILPGDTSALLSEGLASFSPQLGFAGKADFSARDLPSFRRWLAGGQDPGAALVRRFAVKGDIRAGDGSIAIDRAEFAADGARSTGRFAWTAGERDRLDVTLKSEALDLEALGLDRLFGEALKGGETDVAMALEAKSLTLGGVRMSDVAVDASLDQDGVDIRRLDIRDAAGAKISGAGRIAPGKNGPAGSLDFKVAAPDVAPLLTIARAAGAPAAALDPLASRAAALSPVSLALKLEADAEARRLTVSGDVAGGKLDARASAKELSLESATEIELRLVSQDGRRLAALVGLPLSPVAEVSGGEVALKLSGAPARDMRGEARFSALGLDVSMTGGAAVAPEVGLSAQGDVTLRSADLSVLAIALGRLTPGVSPALPISLRAKAALSAEAARFDAMSGEVAGRSVSGRLAMPLDSARAFDGALTVDELPGPALAALAFSPDGLTGADPRSVWPGAAFGPSPARGWNGKIDVKAARLSLPAGRTATDAAFTLGFRRNAVVVENLSAALLGGRLSGSTTVTRSDGEASLNATLRREGARAEQVFGQSSANAALQGAADIRFEAQGSGRTLAGVMGSLTGAGAATLSGGAIRGFDVAAIDRVEPQVEGGLALDASKIADAVERGLGQAELPVARAVAPFTISGGVVRTGGITSETSDARLGGALSVDLRRLMLDADLTLRPARPDAPQVGVSFKGPLSAPTRKVEATDLTAWLSVRAVERETRRIDAMEADIRERAKIARQRADQERKRLDEEKKRVDEERRKAEAERRKRELEAGAPIEAPSRPSGPATGLPPILDINPPGVLSGQDDRPASPPTGVFGPNEPQGQGVRERAGESGRPSDRSRAAQPGATTVPPSILPEINARSLGR